MEKLGVDPKMLIAQIVNFVLLLIILKKFVYKPFLASLKKQADNEKKSLDKIEEFENKEKILYDKKLKLEQEYEEKLKKMYAKMKVETSEAKKKILNEAQVEAEELRKRNLELIEADKKKMMQEFKKQATRISLALTEKTLSEVLSTSLQSEIIKDVTKKLPKVKYAD